MIDEDDFFGEAQPVAINNGDEMSEKQARKIKDYDKKCKWTAIRISKSIKSREDINNIQWRKKNGELLYIREMSNSHLRNATLLTMKKTLADGNINENRRLALECLLDEMSYRDANYKKKNKFK